MTDDQPEAYETPAALWFVPLPNPKKPMLGGALLVVEARDGSRSKVALTLPMMLKFGQAYTAAIDRMVRLTINNIRPPETYGTTAVPLTDENIDTEVAAMLADLEQEPNAIDHSEKENDSE